MDTFGEEYRLVEMCTWGAGIGKIRRGQGCGLDAILIDRLLVVSPLGTGISISNTYSAR
jgi:hypothetical protein